MMRVTVNGIGVDATRQSVEAMLGEPDLKVWILDDGAFDYGYRGGLLIRFRPDDRILRMDAGSLELDGRVVLRVGDPESAVERALGSDFSADDDGFFDYSFSDCTVCVLAMEGQVVSFLMESL